MKDFLFNIFSILKTEKLKFSAFIFFSLALALSEGVSIGLLIPILENDLQNSVFSTLPVIGTLTSYLDGYDKSEKLIIVAAFLATTVTIRGIAQFIVSSLSCIIPLNVQCHLMKKLYNALVSADIAQSSKLDSGYIRTLLREQPIRTVSVVQSVIMIIVSLFVIAIYGLFMLTMSWQMTALALVFVLCVFLLMKMMSGPWLRFSGQQLTNAIEDMHSQVHETILGMLLIKLRIAENVVKSKFSNHVEKYRSIETRRSIFSEMQNPIFATIAGWFICSLLVFGTFFFGSDDNGWASLVLIFIICLYRIMGPASTLVTSQAVISSNVHAFTEIAGFLAKTESNMIENGTRPFEGLKSAITLDHVSMTYDESRGQVLHDVSLDIKANETIALVGPSGSGKSTLISLLMRLRDPNQGQILLDNIDLKDFEIETWRQKISSVSQDIVLFNDSVRNNLTFGLDGISDQEIWQALEFASAKDFVEEMPNQLDEILGEGGSTLSGGQRQRLAMARAIVSKPEFLILDEATSHLDTITEAAIQNTIKNIRQSCTILIVAHRLSTIRDADRIVVMDRGRIVEMGQHEELYARESVYRDLVDSQKFEGDIHAAN